MSDGAWAVLGALIGSLGTIASNLANSWLAKPKVDLVRERRKFILRKMLTDNPDWTWRSLTVLSHTIGATPDATRSLLIEAGAQASEDGSDQWALMDVLAAQPRKPAGSP